MSLQDQKTTKLFKFILQLCSLLLSLYQNLRLCLGSETENWQGVTLLRPATTGGGSKRQPPHPPPTPQPLHTHIHTPSAGGSDFRKWMDGQMVGCRTLCKSHNLSMCNGTIKKWKQSNKWNQDVILVLIYTYMISQTKINNCHHIIILINLFSYIQ